MTWDKKTIQKWDVAETSDRYSSDDRIGYVEDILKEWGL